MYLVFEIKMICLQGPENYHNLTTRSASMNFCIIKDKQQRSALSFFFIFYFSFFFNKTIFLYEHLK
jgi:hypothetical protein